MVATHEWLWYVFGDVRAWRLIDTTRSSSRPSRRSYAADPGHSR
jgi:hypothetical protein